MPKITPFLWFDREAEEAARFYVSIFSNSAIEDVSRREDASGESIAFMVTFTLDGQRFHALNGGPGHPFNDAVSFFVDCDDQEEIDRYWNRFAEDGEPIQCGWIKDKYGIRWQVVPSVLGDLLNDPDDRRSENVMNAMLGMVKLDIAKLEEARDRG